MYRRWIYMLIAIGASMFLLSHPVFSFKEDQGIIYIRSFSMDKTTFYVTQTELKTGAEHITATMSVKGLYYCNWAMLLGCILCFFCFFSFSWRMRLALITAFIAGIYYVLMVFYALRMSDNHYATLYPNVIALLPAVVLQMMVFLRHNIIRTLIDEDDANKGDTEEWSEK